MSYFGETPSVENELKKLRKEINMLKIDADFQPVTQAGHLGGLGVGASSVFSEGLFKLHPTIHNVKRLVTDEDGDSKSGSWNKISLTSSCVIVDKGLSTDNVGGAHSPSNSELEVLVIEGAIGNDGDSDSSNATKKQHDGQLIFIKPKDGYTLILKKKEVVNGNIDIPNDVSISDNEFAILQYYEDAHADDDRGFYLLVSGGGGASSTNSIKEPCRVATTGNNLVPTAIGSTVDGVTIIVGDRVLYKNQNDQEDNGIYVCTNIALTVATMERASDFDNNSEVVAGVQVAIEEGTVHADEVWQLTTNNPIVVGTTNLTWAKISGMDWSTPINSSLIPDTDITYDLGSNTKHFTNIYGKNIQVGSNATLADTNTVGSVNFSGKDNGSNYVNWGGVHSVVDSVVSTA